VPYGCWRRTTLESLGGFDEELVRNQDDELNYRTTRAGGLVWQSPRIRSWYRPRQSLGALGRQYFDYGRWKTVVIRKHGRPAEWRQLAPALALLIWWTCAFLWWPGAVAALALYAGVLLVASMNAAPVKYWPAVPFVFATVHAAYGLGMLRGESREYTWDILRDEVASRVFALAGSLRGRTVADFGCGRGHWLQRFRSAGANVVGIEIDPVRAAMSREKMPQAMVVRADCRSAPIESGIFDVVTQFTLFTSLPEPAARQAAAREMLRVARPGGLIFWYDFFAPNLGNRATHRVGRREIESLFAGCEIAFERISLAAPLARLASRISPRAVLALGRVAFLRTHYLAVIRKPEPA
jgi:SAM-dependent methyltransferase